MSQFPTPADYAGAVLPFLHPTSQSGHYLHVQAVNESIEVFTATSEAEILKEIGDALFYYILGDIALCSRGNPDATAITISAEDWISRGRRAENAIKLECGLRLMKYAAIYGGQWAKSIREPDTKPTRLRRMSEAGSDIIVVLRDLANWHGASLADIAALNYAKLADRNHRGVLLGDGDAR